MAMDAAEIAELVHYAYSVYERYWRPLSPRVVDEICRDFTGFSAKTRPLSSGETGLVSVLKPKTAALLADRVWLQYPGDDPRLDFAFGWESPMAVRLGALLALMKAGGDSDDTARGNHQMLSDPATAFVTTTEGNLARDYCARGRARVSPLYSSPEQRDDDYQSGDYSVVVSIVANVAVVSEDSLNWDQVLEFRQDAEAKAAYRRFVHWLDEEMVGKPLGFISDEVSARLESYRWALRKHGLQTVLGALQRTVGVSNVFGASAATVAVHTLAHEPLIAALSGLGLLVGQAAIYVSTALIERHDLLIQNKDIALVHDIQRKLG